MGSSGVDGISSGWNFDSFVPIVLASSGQQSTNSFVTERTNGFTATTMVLLGMDATATQDEPIQCFAQLEHTDNTIFWYDSQSTGEGIGVRWAWRGYLPLSQGQTVKFIGSSSGTIVWGCVLWGILIPLIDQPT